MDLYYDARAAASRAVLMTAKAVGVELNKITLNLDKGEHLTPEFLKLNPQHTIPTLVDNGFSVWESRVILIYLAEKYGKDDSLYPKDPQQRALVNQRLYFDIGSLQLALIGYFYSIFRGETVKSEDFKKIEDAFGFLNSFLEGKQFVAGSKLTVADISILATVSSFDVLGFKLDRYPNVNKWYEHVQKVTPGWEDNEEGLLRIKAMLEAK